MQVDNSKDLNVVIAMYNIIENNGNYAKTSGKVWKYQNDDPNINITDSKSFKFKAK